MLGLADLDLPGKEGVNKLLVNWIQFPRRKVIWVISEQYTTRGIHLTVT